MWSRGIAINFNNSHDVNIFITSADELALLAQEVNSGTTSFDKKCFILSNDINLVGNDSNGPYEWTPIGVSSDNKYFSGTFNGNGHTVSFNITSGDGENPYSYNYAGLFGCVSGDNAKITNLHVTNFVISVDAKPSIYAGGIAGWLNSGNIENSSASGNISAYSFNQDKKPYTDIKQSCAGGLVGHQKSGTI